MDKQQRVIDLSGLASSPLYPTAGVIESLAQVMADQQYEAQVIYLPLMNVSLSIERLRLFDSLQFIEWEGHLDADDAATHYLLLRCWRGTSCTASDTYSSIRMTCEDAAQAHIIMSDALDALIVANQGLYIRKI